MEARVTRAPLLLLLGLVLVLRLPFLNQAIQGDDHIYLAEAEHALIDPLHPNNARFVFLSIDVDLRGHSHPPGNAWPLAGLLLLFGDVKEVPFHAAYLVFSLIAVWSVWSIARRFTEHPVWATLLFIAVPAFVVNGNSLESDLPFLAFFLAAIALSSAGWAAGSVLALAPLLAIAAWRKRSEPATLFLILWIAIFFLCGLPIFFAGSARYLLPIAAPLAILASRLPAKVLAPAFAIHLAIGLGLAAANYQHWDGYRRFAESIRSASAGHRVFVDYDWGLRYYIVADLGRPALMWQHLRTG